MEPILLSSNHPVSFDLGIIIIIIIMETLPPGKNDPTNAWIDLLDESSPTTSENRPCRGPGFSLKYDLQPHYDTQMNLVRSWMLGPALTKHDHLTCHAKTPVTTYDNHLIRCCFWPICSPVNFLVFLEEHLNEHRIPYSIPGCHGCGKPRCHGISPPSNHQVLAVPIHCFIHRGCGALLDWIPHRICQIFSQKCLP